MGLIEKIASENVEYFCAPAVMHERLGFKSKSTPLMIEVSETCNMKCVHCYNDALYLTDVSKRTMCESKCSEIKNTLLYYRSKSTSVSFLGGEPLLNKRICSLIEYAVELKYKKIIVNTNSLNVRKEHVFCFKKNDVLVSISLPGLSRKEFDGSTGIQGSFFAVCKNVNKLIDAGVNVHCAIIGRYSEHDVTDFIKSNNLDRVLFSYSMHDIEAVGRAHGNYNDNRRCCLNCNVIYIDWNGKERGCPFGYH